MWRSDRILVMRLSPRAVRKFQNFIFTWWGAHQRDLPWRQTHDPYKILISEVMLQQTQVSRVLPKYEQFLYLFPDIYALASSSPSKVLKAWRGMGYNRRALYLHKTATMVVKKYAGEFPDREVLLSKLPGVGKYTARALLVFAYRQNVALIDTNIRQIITHFFFSGAQAKEKDIQLIADKLVPPDQSWEWHQALMDYGALELPKIKVKSGSARKKAPPFRESNRFYRGRIVDALRVARCDKQKLLASLKFQYKKSEHDLERILQSLIDDGLVVKRGKHIELPG